MQSATVVNRICHVKSVTARGTPIGYVADIYNILYITFEIMTAGMLLACKADNNANEAKVEVRKYTIPRRMNTNNIPRSFLPL